MSSVDVPRAPGPTGETLLGTLLTGEPDAQAIVTPGDAGGGSTFEALQARVERLARQLRHAGVDRGDRVALVLDPGGPFLECLFAVLAVGAAAAPLNPGYTASELAFYLDDIEPEVIVLPAGGMAAAREAALSRSGLVVADLAIRDGEPVLSVRGASVPAGASINGPGAGDVALLLHTSGTTSRPKQVPLLHRNLMSTVRAVARHYRLGSDDVSYCLMPLFHVHGLVASVWAALAAGGRVVVPVRQSSRTFLRSLEHDRVTWFSASPTILQRMLDRSGAAAPSLRFVRSCSAPLHAGLELRLEEAYGVPVLQAYGMTEASHQISSNPHPPAPRVRGSVGVPTGAEVRIVDDAGRPVEAERAGHVLVRGPGVTPGYLNAPEANQEAFADGWFRTGDLGVLDRDGYLRLTGRAKEIIIRGGENVSPYEVEATLLEHPAVVDAVCFAIPDEKYGEEVGAAVRTRSEVDERELRAFCGDRLARYKVPKAIHRVDAMPTTATGKVQRRQMHALLHGVGGDR